jgi:hypothetical protein
MLPTKIILPILCVAWLSACSEQGEGERCDTNSGSLDCASGLTCRLQEPGVSLCCPPNDGRPTVDACRAGAQLPPDDQPPPAPVGDAGTALTPAPVVDAGP